MSPQRTLVLTRSTNARDTRDGGGIGRGGAADALSLPSSRRANRPAAAAAMERGPLAYLWQKQGAWHASTNKLLLRIAEPRRRGREERRQGREWARRRRGEEPRTPNE